jgi:Uma2 family endonuclease
MAMRATLGDREVLPLENGDTLTREEFERRYEASPGIKKAELIDGVVYLGSPVSVDHSQPHLRLGAWLAQYVDLHPEVEGHDNVTLVLPGTNEPQPDLLLRYKTGSSRLNEKKYIEGAPELVVEIAASSSSLDMHSKRRMYERAGIPEYLVWRTRNKKVDWFVLEEGKYRPLEADADGVLESRQFPGLRLSVDVVLNGTLGELLGMVR